MFDDTRALTGIRGIAAVWVMAGHFTRGLSNLPADQFLSKAYLAVDLFFVLSGFVIALNNSAFFVKGEPSDACLSFYRRRIARVYPLLLFVIILTLAYDAVVGLALPSPFGLLTNLTMTNVWFLQDGIIPSGWSVSVEAFSYLAFPWIAALVFRRTSIIAVGVIFVALAGLWWLTTLDPSKYFGELDPGGPLDIRRGTYPILRGFCEFVTGVGAYRLLRLPRVRLVMETRGLPETLIVTIALLVGYTNLDLVVAILFVPLVCAIAVPRHAASRALRSRLALQLGNLSYALYLAHMLVGSVIRDTLVGTVPIGVVLLACASASIAFAGGLHAFIEKPSQTFFHRKQHAQQLNLTPAVP